jgi:hypothetical protein
VGSRLNILTFDRFRESKDKSLCCRSDLGGQEGVGLRISAKLLDLMPYADARSNGCLPTREFPQSDLSFAALKSAEILRLGLHQKYGQWLGINL